MEREAALLKPIHDTMNLVVQFEDSHYGSIVAPIRRSAATTYITREIVELKITVHSDYNYIEFVTSGVVDNAGSIEMARTIAETMKHHRVTKALIDHRNVTNITGTVMDVYERPKIFRLIGMILGIKIAEIVNPDHVEHFKFLETVCINQGFKFMIFNDRSKGLEWLLG
jgi:hypothetical protein